MNAQSNAISNKTGGGLSYALGRGASWRYLLLFVIAMAIPTAIELAPIHGFFKSLFDMSTRAESLVGSLDSAAFTEVLRQFGEPEASGIQAGFFGVFLVTAFLAPLLAGMAVALAREDAPEDFRSLLGEGATLYPRMLRTSVASAIPLGIAGGLAAAFAHFASSHAEHAVTESSASTAGTLSTVGTILVFWLANAIVESGRAHFAVDDDRKSALGALWAGVKLLGRRPGKVLGTCFVTTLLGVGGAAIVTALRLRLPQSGGGSVVFALLVAQGAVVLLAWGRASKLAGLADVIRTGKTA